MEYQVPQFIEVEDKIFGPFTLKQFIYLAGGVGLCAVFILYVHPLFLAILLSIPVAGLTGALAFYRINNKAFIDILEAGFNFYRKGRLYLWKKEDPVQAAAPMSAPAPVQMVSASPQKLAQTRNRLHDLALSLDIQNPNPPQA